MGWLVLVVLGVIVLVLTLTVFILTLCYSKSGKDPSNRHPHRHHWKGGLAQGAIRNANNTAFVDPQICNPESDVVHKVGAFQTYTPFVMGWAPMGNTIESYRLYTAGMQKLDEFNGRSVVVMAIHGSDGVVRAPGGKDPYPTQIANTAFQQCISFCPPGYVEKEVNGEFTCVPDSGSGPSSHPIAPNHCKMSYMNIKQVFWNPVVDQTKTPIGFVGMGPRQPDEMTPILPRTNRFKANQNLCVDTAGNLFGGYQTDAPWVFGELHGSVDTGEKISVYGTVLNGAQLMVAYPGEEDWLAPNSGVDVSTMGWGIVSAGVNVPQPSGPVILSDTGYLRMDGYFLQSDPKDPFAPKELTGKTLWEDKDGALFNTGTVSDLRLENGFIWVIFASSDLATYIARFKVTSSSGILGLDSTTTMALDKSFGGGKGYLGMAGQTYVDMLVQYIPVPWKTGLVALNPATVDGKDVVNRVAVISTIDASSTLQLWGCAWNATAVQNLKSSVMDPGACLAPGNVPIGLMSSGRMHYYDKSHDVPGVALLDVYLGDVAARTYYTPTSVGTYSIGIIGSLFSVNNASSRYCQWNVDLPHPDTVFINTTYPQGNNIWDLITVPPFWMAPLGIENLKTIPLYGYYLNPQEDGTNVWMADLKRTFPYARPINTASWGYVLTGVNNRGVATSSVTTMMNFTETNLPGAGLIGALGGLPSPSSLPRVPSPGWTPMGYQTKTVPPSLTRLYPKLQDEMNSSLAGKFFPYLDIFYGKI